MAKSYLGLWIGLVSLATLSAANPVSLPNSQADSKDKIALSPANPTPHQFSGHDTVAPANPDAKAVEGAKAATVNPKPDREVIKCRLKRGGTLYDEYATALHTKRLRNEFTAAQWKTILLQKRIRIPLTAADHQALLQFFVHE